MAIQPEDTKTDDLFNVQTMIEVATEDAHLAEHHSLVKVHAYIKDPKAAKKKTANSERQAKHAEKLKSEGLVKANVPAPIGAAIREAGGFAAWLDAQKAASAPVVELVEVPVPGPERIVEVEKIVSVTVPPTEKEIRLRSLGKRCAALSGWRRVVVFKILGVK